MMWVWHTGLAGLSNTHRTVGTLSSPRAHSCQQSNAYVEGESSLQIRQLSRRSCSLRRVSKIFVEIFHEHLQIHKIHEIKDPQKILRYMVVCSLVPRPHPLTRKRVWWLLSTALAVPSQQSWFLNNWTIIASLHCAISLACSESILLTLHNQESAQCSQDPFPRERVGSGHETSLYLTSGQNFFFPVWLNQSHTVQHNPCTPHRPDENKMES